MVSSRLPRRELSFIVAAWACGPGVELQDDELMRLAQNSGASRGAIICKQIHHSDQREVCISGLGDAASSPALTVRVDIRTTTDLLTALRTDIGDRWTATGQGSEWVAYARIVSWFDGLDPARVEPTLAGRIARGSPKPADWALRVLLQDRLHHAGELDAETCGAVSDAFCAAVFAQAIWDGMDANGTTLATSCGSVPERQRGIDAGGIVPRIEPSMVAVADQAWSMLCDGGVEGRAQGAEDQKFGAHPLRHLPAPFESESGGRAIGPPN